MQNSPCQYFRPCVRARPQPLFDLEKAILYNNKLGIVQVKLGLRIYHLASTPLPTMPAHFAVPLTATSGKEVLWSKQMLARSRDASELWMSVCLFH